MSTAPYTFQFPDIPAASINFYIQLDIIIVSELIMEILME
jgi:hypothetical protein